MLYQQKYAWLFERQKVSLDRNNIMLIDVMAVTSVKHSEQDTEQACSVICTVLERLTHQKLHCTPWSS